ncbi:MAG TPA: tetratricopeptide repeat protein [Casimicrobiaceae bacterium]|nr:tetratricopeptide repeat protein [Casimicrobiaceae bacterium]
MTAAAGARSADFSTRLDSRWDFAKPEVSENRFREALSQYPAHSREALEIGTQIARAMGLQRKFDAAHAVLDRIEPDLDRVDARVRMRYLLERGRTFNSAGSPVRAVPLFRQAAEVAARAARDTDAFYEIDALHMLGISAPASERLGWNEKALAAAEKSKEARARGWRGSLYHNIGWTHFERGDHGTALDYWQKALAVREAANDGARTRVARWTVARGYRALGRLDDAEKLQRDLVADNAKSGEEDGYVYEELAEIELARGDRKAAAPWAAKAYALLREDAWLASTEPARLKRLAQLGGLGPAPDKP